MSREGIGIREFDDMGDVRCDKLHQGLLFTEAGIKLWELERVDLLDSSLSGPNPEVVPWFPSVRVVGSWGMEESSGEIVPDLPCVALGLIEAALTASPAGLLEFVLKPSRVPVLNSCELPVPKSLFPFWWESSSLSGPNPEVVPWFPSVWVVGSWRTEESSGEIVLDLPCIALGSIEAAFTASPAGSLEFMLKPSCVPVLNSCELPTAKSSSPIWWESSSLNGPNPEVVPWFPSVWVVSSWGTEESSGEIVPDFPCVAQCPLLNHHQHQGLVTPVGREHVKQEVLDKQCKLEDTWKSIYDDLPVCYNTSGWWSNLSMTLLAF